MIPGKVVAELTGSAWVLMAFSIVPVRRVASAGGVLKLWIGSGGEGQLFAITPTLIDRMDDGIIVLWTPLSIADETGIVLRDQLPSVLIRQDRFDALCASC